MGSFRVGGIPDADARKMAGFQNGDGMSRGGECSPETARGARFQLCCTTGITSRAFDDE